MRRDPNPDRRTAMSNYPPGVTGREWIFEEHDYDAHRTCDADAPALAVPQEIERWLRDVLNGVTGTRETSRALLQRNARDLLKELDRLGYVDDVECGFEGQVEVRVSGPPGQIASARTAAATWECPWCATEHEEDLDP